MKSRRKRGEHVGKTDKKLIGCQASSFVWQRYNQSNCLQILPHDCYGGKQYETISKIGALMNLTIREMPGARPTPQYRLMFSEKPGAHPVEFPRIEGVEALEQFIERLGEPEKVARRIIADLQDRPGGTTYIENVLFDAAGLQDLLREIEAEEQEPAVKPKQVK